MMLTREKQAPGQRALQDTVIADVPLAQRTHKSLLRPEPENSKFQRTAQDANWVELPRLSELFLSSSVLAATPVEETGTPLEAIGIAAAPVLRTRDVAWYGSPESTNSEYALRHELGAGGMGTVYEAHQLSVGRSVAFKILKPELAMDDALVKAFMAEGAVTAELEHPCIVPLYDLGHSALTGTPFYVMKQVRGGAWSAIVDSQTNSQRVEIMLRICDAIAFAHSRGILHRDLKPDNVMLGDFGEVLVMDWGLAVTVPIVAVDGRISYSTPKAPPVSTSTIGGTPAYMAPELAGPDLDKIGLWSDVYLLGATLWRAVTGKPPHGGRTLSECLPKVYANIIDDPTDDGASECAAFGRSELIAIARKAMATDPKERYAGALEFQTALRDWQGHTQSAAMAFQAEQLLSAAEAEKNPGYQRYAIAVFTYEEALRLWPENPCAKEGVREARLAHASLALDKGDLELAESILVDGDHQLLTSPVGDRLRAMRQEQACSEYHRETLSKAAEKWSLAFELSPDPMLILRLEDAVVLEANSNFEKVTGWSKSEVIGHSTLHIGLWVNVEDRARFTSILRETGEVQGFEAQFRRKSGEPYDVLVSACLAEFDGMQVIVANSRDISHLRAQESELRRAHERLERTQSIARIGTWEYHPDTGHMWWSAETYRILGLQPSTDAAGLKYDEYMSMVLDQDRPTLEQALRECTEHGTGFRLKVRHSIAGGKIVHCLARGEAVTDADGHVAFLLGSVMESSAAIL
jgi:PAS domain S-box-containing protein